MGCEFAGEMKYARGLEGVTAAITSIACIDGEEGKLIYRGIPIEQMAEYSTFEETAYLLWFGKLPTAKELEDLKEKLVKERALSDDIIDHMRKFPKDADPMDVLRTAVSLLGMTDPEVKNPNREVNIRHSIKMTAKIPTIISAYHRLRNGKDPIPPRNDLSHAANFLYMLLGEVPDPQIERIMDIALILHAEHGMNASTFAAMVTASTLSDLYSAVVSAIGTLKGPLHGGANTRVLYMLEEIGSLENVEKYVLDALKEHRKIMGFGHRVYKAYDPRARILKRYAKELSEKKGDTLWYRMGEEIERIMIREVGKKGIFPNVDFYSGMVYHHMGIPRDLFTPIFALSRVVGWTAHILEYLEANRIFRPRAIYNGPIDVEYTPIEKRQ